MLRIIMQSVIIQWVFILVTLSVIRRSDDVVKIVAPVSVAAPSLSGGKTHFTNKTMLLCFV
jgi:hypothetical protein